MYWSDMLSKLNTYLSMFTELLSDTDNMEFSRDTIHEMLYETNKRAFLLNQKGTDVKELCYYMFNSEENVVYQSWYCNKCKYEEAREAIDEAHIWHCSKLVWKNKAAKLGARNEQSVSVWLKAILRSKSEHKCSIYYSVVDRMIHFDDPPVVIPLTIESGINIKLEQETYLYGNKYQL